MILVTGAAGFIGSHLTDHLASQGHEVVAIDAFRGYYSIDLKQTRVRILATSDSIEFVPIEISQLEPTSASVGDVRAIVHLAAQPGVRLPLARYGDYECDNIAALAQVLAFARTLPRKPVLLLASSSSVYGDAKPPFREDSTDLRPTSYYGSTKLLGERMAEAFARQSGIPTIAMRFFTAYGPWGRPDMAYFRLAAAALGAGRFSLFGDGSVRRDFTHVDDIVVAIALLLEHLSEVRGPYFEAVNIGGGRPTSMNELISLISNASDVSPEIDLCDSDPRDAPITEADFGKLLRLTGQSPQVEIEEGVRRLMDWARDPAIRPNLPSWISPAGDSSVGPNHA